MATYPTQHETFFAMLAEVQRNRTKLVLRDEATVRTEDTTADARELVSSAA